MIMQRLRDSGSFYLISFDWETHSSSIYLPTISGTTTRRTPTSKKKKISFPVLQMKLITNLMMD